MIVTGFLNKRFRAGESYRLVEWNQLEDNDRSMLSNAGNAGEIYGIFKPVSSANGLMQKIAWKEQAFIFLHCKNYHQLPNYVLSQPYGRYENIITEMLIDHVLELQYEEDFISGPGASAMIFDNNWLTKNSLADKLSTLSANAIRYSLYLRNETAKSLGNKLYTFNVIPRDKNSKQYLSAAKSINDFIYSGFEHSEMLSKNWSLNRERKYWFSWSRNEPLAGYEHTEVAGTYKLYLSPIPDAVPAFFNIAVPVLTRSNATGFKIGQTIDGLLRPDKMIAYFNNREDLFSAAKELEVLSNDIPAHGVPFTTQLDKSGLISFGIDHAFLKLKRGYSWRTWVTEVLAKTILQAKTENLSMEFLFQYIKARLFTERINIDKWSFIDETEDNNLL